MKKVLVKHARATITLQQPRPISPCQVHANQSEQKVFRFQRAHLKLSKNFEPKLLNSVQQVISK